MDEKLNGKLRCTGSLLQQLGAQVASKAVADADDEIVLLRSLVAELLDTELGELACAGSMAPVEDVLGRMKAAIAA